MTAQWQEFFGLLAQISATAFAVLLATLQLARRRWRGFPLKEAAAGMALLELLVVLLAALVAAVPGSDWRAGYVVMGLAGLIGLAWYVRTVFRHEDETDLFDERQVTWGLPASCVVYVGLVAFAAAGTRHGVAVLSIWLILSGSGRAWLLLDASRAPRPAGDSVRTEDGDRRA